MISLDSLCKAVSKSKPEKADGDSELTSSHLKAATPIFLVHLALLLLAMGRHGHVANSSLKGTTGCLHLKKSLKCP